MGVGIEIRFPHRRFHATPWDEAANSGEEWPPAPWRLLRALLSIWHLKCSDLPSETVDALVDQLKVLPEIRVPESRVGHTRHYMPLAKHLSGEPNTSLILDTYRSVHPDDPVVFWWPELSLSAEQMAGLNKLVHEMTYFGRGESVCCATVVTTASDGEWLRPDVDGTVRAGHDTTRVLTADPDCTRKELEVDIGSFRKSQLRSPRGSRWVTYTAPELRDQAQETVRRSAQPGPQAFRWRLTGKAPFLIGNALLATDALRGSRIVKAGGPGTTDGSEVMHGHLPRDDQGKVLDPTTNTHAHWLWVHGTRNGISQVTDVVAYIPGGIPEKYIDQIMDGKPRRALRWDESAPERSGRPDDNFPYRHSLPDYTHPPAGYAPSPLQFVGAGDIATVVPEWGWDELSTRWVSVTPYLMALHPKKNRDPSEFVERDVLRSWERRRPGQPAPAVSFFSQTKHPLRDAPGLSAPEWEMRPNEFRSQRPRQRSATFRIPLWVELTFPEPSPAPPPLGHLAHFGFGIFRPAP